MVEDNLPNEEKRDAVPAKSDLHKKYFYFRRLLGANNRALEIISDLEQIIFQDKPFSFAYVLRQTELLMGEVFSIVEDVNTMSGVRYTGLFDTMERVCEAVFSKLRKKKRLVESSLVLSLERVSLESANDVGGKAANLGEVCNRAHLPVPPGFAVTAYAFQQFLDFNNLTDIIDTKLEKLDVNDTETLIHTSLEIQTLMMKGELPPMLEKAILDAARALKGRIGEDLRVSVRSSATSEDSEASFAGQYSTVLNVREDGLIRAYKQVLSSIFNPRAIFYRRRKGYPDHDIIMSVACVRMIDTKISGVMYTADPNDRRNGLILINAVWGLAVSVVEGSEKTDFFQIDKRTKEIVVSRVAPKSKRITPDPIGGIREEALPYELKNRACLDRDQVRRIVDWGLRLERHYGHALDIEWAIDQDGRLSILQARPLGRSRSYGERGEKTCPKREFPNHPILLQAGTTASDGTASGPAYVLESDHMFHHIPEGAIVIAKQTSPRYVPLMGRIRAIVTDVGSVTGHMASVAREFQIPALVGTGSATKRIPHGSEITVDAANMAVYRGRVASLLKERKPLNPMKGSPIYKTVKEALTKISPLNLTDPKQEDFRPDGCRTIHDIIRFSHEMAMHQMFRIGKDLDSGESSAVPLQTFLPMKILIVDLGKGVMLRPGGKVARFENVASVPFRALLTGMTLRAVPWNRDAADEMLHRCASETGVEDETVLVEETGVSPNYAIVSGNYLNFNARLGYYFATIDTYCGPMVNDNYITFHFKGGAADMGRRSRRAQLIFMIIRELGFKSEQKGDMVRGDLKKYLSRTFEEKLDMLGRLLGYVGYLDSIAMDDEPVEWYVDQFLEGNYSLK